MASKLFPMSEAPRDGTRILLRYRQRYYSITEEWRYRDTPKWEECWWISEKATSGSEPHWEPWEGSSRTRTTEHIYDEHCLGWLPLPETEDAPPA